MEENVDAIQKEEGRYQHPFQAQEEAAPRLTPRRSSHYRDGIFYIPRGTDVSSPKLVKFHLTQLTNVLRASREHGTIDESSLLVTRRVIA